jgi:integrase/recombinase XerD
MVGKCSEGLLQPLSCRSPAAGYPHDFKKSLDSIIADIDRSTPEGRRDYALIAFAYQTGARVAEIIGLRACDLQLEVLPQVRIWGKGRKERVVPLWPKAAALLSAWLEERKVDPRSTAVVFVNMRGQPLTRWGVRYIMKKHARGAAASCPSVATKRVHPHVIRHTTAVHMLEAGADTSAIRDLFGHESVDTTWRYTRLRMELKRKTMEACAPRSGSESPVPVWRRDPDLLAQLEAIGRRRAFVPEEDTPPSRKGGGGVTRS